jgi:hypothetical protein
MTFIVVLLALFGIKHFVCDFVLQTNNMLSDKGIYGAPGGRNHAIAHAIGTFIVLVIALPWRLDVHIVAIVLGILDGLIHYHIDWAKTNLSSKYTSKDREFWIYLGADQGLHYLTYVGIIAVLVLL